ncbi:MAG TPA: FAD-linked oxidase C-terminal domain-containing protein [Thermodesulfobacteriota bacterium]|nr:FAD-linked oxidase C-terminal domain-containing protein [Thermodesulfobacteriota bacterium]
MRRIVGPEAVIADPAELAAYECDGLTAFKHPPDLVVLPETADQVQAVVRVCREEGVVFVPRGAGTGLSGGALPVEGGVLIGLSRMNRILEIDLPNQRAVVEPGVVNIWLSERLAPHGYYYAPDPASQRACTIGGNVAENSGGPHCLKYGVTTNHVLGLEVVLPDGERVHLGGRVCDPLGYDLVGVFVGSEGTFGIATAIEVRILKTPEAVRTLLAVFDEMDDASNAVSGIIAAGIIPAAVEMMDNLSIQAVEAAVQAGYPTDAGAVLLVELDGPAAGLDAQAAVIEGVLRANRVREIRVARDEAERAALWKGRKHAFGAMGRISPDYYVQDAVIPRTRLMPILRVVAEAAARHGLRVANVFHAGDGNLHPLILYDGSRPGQLEAAEAAGAEIMQACIAAGGSITGEHGVGIEKRDFMPLMFSEADLEAMRKLKAVFNPDGRLNPGKIFPTQRACGEVASSHRAPHPIEVAGLAQRF